MGGALQDGLSPEAPGQVPRAAQQDPQARRARGAQGSLPLTGRLQGHCGMPRPHAGFPLFGMPALAQDCTGLSASPAVCRCLYYLVHSRGFELGVMAIIVANALLMATTHYGQVSAAKGGRVDVRG